MLVEAVQIVPLPPLVQTAARACAILRPMQPLTLLIVGLAASLTTLIGGVFALRLRDKLHLVLGFSAGAIIAVVFFELIPEAIELGSGFFATSTLLTFTALGFFTYMVLDRFILLHTHSGGDDCVHSGASLRGLAGASSLSAHSFLDGFAIGLAFQASFAVGAAVAVAVLVHKFSDGINTVSLLLKNGGTKSQALRWLFIAAAAPALGVLSTLFFVFPENILPVVLATFAGFFFYIGAADLLPESHHAHPRLMTTLMTLLGAGVLYIVIAIAG